MNEKKIFVVGGNGQLGMALRKVINNAKFVDRDEFDMTDDSYYEKEDWSAYDTIINVAAYTAVDDAETTEGRISAWKINADAVAKLARTANKHDLTLVHISSEYVFDGTKEMHDEEEPFSPLGVYGQTKAAGDIAASTANKYYIIRTSWVIGDGNNFVKTMASLAKKGIKPKVVDDQIGRLTFTSDLAEAISFILSSKEAKYGTYNFTNEGKPVSWAEVARQVFELSGKSRDDVSTTTSHQYFKDKPDASPRPLNSTLDLKKIKNLGFKTNKWEDALKNYMKEIL